MPTVKQIHIRVVIGVVAAIAAVCIGLLADKAIERQDADMQEVWQSAPRR